MRITISFDTQCVLQSHNLIIFSKYETIFQ